MSGFLKRYIGLAVFAGGSSALLAFSLLGPFKVWQVVQLGYNVQGDVGGPMTLAEGYRWNVPNIYYAFDQSFITYFGTEGIDAVEEAITILNELPNASEITTDGTRLFIDGRRVPYDTKRINYQAQADNLLDLKSFALRLLIEEMGLTEPERYVWTLRGREVETIAGVTFTNYSVIKLNYDPITLQPSSVVNGVPYTYTILEPFGFMMHAEAVEEPAVPLTFSFTSVASGFLSAGEFYTGLTHDDIGGLRFLLNPNNFAVETPAATATRGIGQDGDSPWRAITSITNTLGTNVPTVPGGTNVLGSNIANIVTAAVRPGLDKLNFRRANFDSLIGINFITVTNAWRDRYVSNGVLRTQPLQRAVAQPDVLFTVDDLGIIDDLVPFLIGRTSTANWNNNDALNGLSGQSGPGVIGGGGTNGTITIFFTDQLPFFLHQSPFLNENNAIIGSGVWASFDASTNPPIIYPRYLDLTLEDLRNLPRND